MKEDLKVKTIARLKKRKGRKAAIDAMCCHCIYDPRAMGAGSWKKQVTECTSNDCPLFVYRPISTSQNDDKIPMDEEE